MKYVHSAQASVIIYASVSEVWEALTNPKMIKQYFFGTNTITDWKVGHPIVFEGEWQGHKYRDKGRVLDYRENDQLKYDYWSSISGMEDSPENYGVVSYEIFGDDEVTTLVVTQENIPNEEVKEHSTENWKHVLQELKKMLEKEPTWR